jgi:hypothetical protein
MLVAGGLVAGAINTLAGGGSFLTVPLLVLVGLPAGVANATNRVGVLFQSASATAAFRREGFFEPQLSARILPVTLAGSWLGAWIASWMSDELFGRAFGVVMLLALPVILANPRPRAQGPRHPLALPLEQLVYLAIGVYGGAIQAGIGIPLLLALVGFSGLDLVRAISARVLITTALTLVALAQFVWAGKVVWTHALVLAIGQSAGGYAAARLGARVGPRLVRPVLIVCVVALSLRMLLG